MASVILPDWAAAAAFAATIASGVRSTDLLESMERILAGKGEPSKTDCAKIGHGRNGMFLRRRSHEPRWRPRQESKHDGNAAEKEANRRPGGKTGCEVGEGRRRAQDRT